MKEQGLLEDDDCVDWLATKTCPYPYYEAMSYLKENSECYCFLSVAEPHIYRRYSNMILNLLPGRYSITGVAGTTQANSSIFGDIQEALRIHAQPYITRYNNRANKQSNAIVISAAIKPDYEKITITTTRAAIPAPIISAPTQDHESIVDITKQNTPSTQTPLNSANNENSSACLSLKMLCCLGSDPITSCGYAFIFAGVATLIITALTGGAAAFFIAGAGGIGAGGLLLGGRLFCRPSSNPPSYAEAVASSNNPPAYR